MLKDLAVRFVVGGLIVSGFALLGNLFRPKSFAGLFGAAPSVALATLTLTVSKEGKTYAATEARSMILGAAALCVYTYVVAQLLARHQIPALRATLYSLPVWFGVGYGLYFAFFR